MSDKARRSRRRWSEAFKRRVVAEVMAPGASAAAIARCYDLSANLFFQLEVVVRDVGSILAD